MVRNRLCQDTWCQPPNKQLQRTVIQRPGDGASAPFHYALAPRVTRQRAAAELRRYTPCLSRRTLWRKASRYVGALQEGER
jgi:hypothetical protein